MSVTCGHVPEKPAQDPFDSAATSRSTTPELESTPAPLSVPLTNVNGTDSDVYQGPPERSALWPVGPDVSGVSVKVSVAVRPALSWAVTVFAPLAVLLASQS